MLNKFFSLAIITAVGIVIVLILSVVSFDYRGGGYVCRSSKKFELGHATTLLNVSDFIIRLKPITYTCPADQRIDRSELEGL